MWWWTVLRVAQGGYALACHWSDARTTRTWHDTGPFVIREWLHFNSCSALCLRYKRLCIGAGVGLRSKERKQICTRKSRARVQDTTMVSQAGVSASGRGASWAACMGASACAASFFAFRMQRTSIRSLSLSREALPCSRFFRFKAFFISTLAFFSAP